MIRIFKLKFQETVRIGLQFTPNEDWSIKIKSIATASYSVGHQCWHIAYNSDSYKSFLALNLPYKIHLTSENTKTPSKSENIGIRANRPVLVTAPNGHRGETNIPDFRTVLNIVWNQGQFYIKIDYRRADVDFLKSLTGCWWNGSHKQWVVRGTLENLNKLQNHFVYWNKDSFDRLLDKISTVLNPYQVYLFKSPEHNQSVIVKVEGYLADIQVLKQFPGRCYDKKLKRWILPYHEEAIGRLITHYEGKGAKIINRIPKTDQSYKKTIPSYSEYQTKLVHRFKQEDRAIIKKYTDSLIRMRYSWRTVKSYTGKFYLYYKYLGEKNIANSTPEDANKFLVSISKERVSDSLINVTVSAIKFYYEKVVFLPGFNLERVKRPRKGRSLPQILSVQEVNRLLKSTQNLKHACMLYTLYSSGMRISEILSLQVKNINWDRNQIFIKAGKGKKDRVVMLSQYLKEILILYID